MKRIANPPDKYWEVLKIMHFSPFTHGTKGDTFNKIERIRSIEMFKNYNDYCVFIFSNHDNERLSFGAVVGFLEYLMLIRHGHSYLKNHFGIAEMN